MATLLETLHTSSWWAAGNADMAAEMWRMVHTKCKRWITPRIPYLPKPCHNYCMEWQVFCFSVLHLGPFYFKSFGACAISTPNKIRSKRHLWQKENIVQMRSGFLWFRSAAWVDLRISNGARRIKSVRVTFITRFRNSAREPVKYRSLNQKQLWPHKNRASSACPQQKKYGVFAGKQSALR